ncbi:sigma 54-interacting transcriptional regulator [Candidatus Arsenophonus nilaparvatae]|uniref:sigma 54-interacting transcriptional regulator n=1 Tax=Candidatus Arsenophonus nilaparvatae TaxID=1247023 RepID=UPI000509BE25|nr:sigma 54-interacting transcriptional regulator [Candidatus Arsenophonus nilaparvatae]
MLGISSQSALMQIQPTILRFTKVLSRVLQLEVEIVDGALRRVAGSGPYGKYLGQKLERNSRLLRYVIQTGKEKVVIQSRLDPLCEDCENKVNCKEKAFLGTPIFFQDVCVGVISLVAFTHEQQERIKHNLHEFSDYVQHISTIFISKLLDEQSGVNNTSSALMTLVDNIDQGVLILNSRNKLKLVNAIALNILNLNYEKIIGKAFTIRPLIYQESFTGGHMQYVITCGDISEILTGQLHNIQDYQIFLMAFHQLPLYANSTFESAEPQIEHLVGESPPMRKLKKLISRIAPGPSSVLIIGESGTGKEVVARAIHKLSHRSNKAFVAINCAAIPEQLLESELFGYVKGAFTGASTNGKQGLIQAANQGTLFLDEVGDMPLVIQAKLLRAIEAREIQPIGASKAVPVDIRIISATNQNLEKFVREGKFREDLYYRLNVIPLALPPLRERQGDLLLLIHYFLNLHTKRLGLVYPGISQEVLERLKAYHWPGNLRELSNLMEYLINVTSSGDVIDIALLPPNLVNHRKNDFKVETLVVPNIDLNEPAIDGAVVLEDMEKQLIREALSRYGSKKQAAKMLGIGIATLYRKIKRYELTSG